MDLGSFVSRGQPSALFRPSRCPSRRVPGRPPAVRLVVAANGQPTPVGAHSRQPATCTLLVKRRDTFVLASGAWLCSSWLEASGQTAGLTLEAALATTLDIRRQTAYWSMHPSEVPRSEELQTISAALADSLPVVGAEAAYTQNDWRLKLRGSPIDSMIGAFALLDRAADGASQEGPNRNISIKDIERLEELEALTCEALEAMDRLVLVRSSEAVSGEDETSGRGLVMAREIRRVVASLDDIISQVPKQAVAAASASHG